MPGQALDEPTLANDTLSEGLSSLGSVIPMVPLAYGNKRKASNLEDVETSRGASPMSPYIKLEPGSPKPLGCKGSNISGAQLELRRRSTSYVSSSSSESTEDQALGVLETEGPITTKPSRTPLAADAQLHMSSRDMSMPLKQRSKASTAKVTLDYEKGTNDLLRPLPVPDQSMRPRRQKACGPPKGSYRHTRSVFEDVAYNSIPDYAPPVSSLPVGDPHVLQVEWRKRTYVDLSNDPDRNLLHEAELKLATSLNLSCAKYLCTKRRIFQARLKVLRAGGEFKKGDYVKACKINSNKASRLCGAFEKVGWFDKKHFLEYLDESSNPLRNTNDEIHQGRETSSSGLTEPDIWDVSESEFHFTSEGDEESTDDDTADSSVSFNSKHGETDGWRNRESNQDNILSKRRHGLSLIGGNGSQRTVLIDRYIQNNDTLGNETVNEGLMTEDTGLRADISLREAVYPRGPDGLSGDDAEEAPMLKTRSMTQNIKRALENPSRDNRDRDSTIKAKSDKQHSSTEKLHRPAVSVNRSTAREPVPHTLEEANAADIMLVKMKEKGCQWFEIEEAWEKKTGKAQTTKTLSCRYARIMASIGSTQLGSDEEWNGDRSLTYRRLELNDVIDNDSITRPTLDSSEMGELLLAAEAEIEKKFQREKADIIAEMENHFQSEKWNLVAEAMSRKGLAHHSAELIQAQYERLTRDSKRADAKDEENHDTSTDLSRRTTRGVSGKKTVTKYSDSNRQATTTNKEKQPAKKSRKCESCGKKFESRVGLIYHLEYEPNCESTTIHENQKRKFNSYSEPGYTQLKTGNQGPFTNSSAPPVSSPDSIPHRIPTALPQADRIHKAPGLQATSLGRPVEGAEHGARTVRKDESQIHAKQSARARRIWAIRRMLGTNGRHGGPPKARKIANKATRASPGTAPNAGTALAPTAAYKSSHVPNSLPSQTQPIVFEKEGRGDANQHKRTPAHITPAAAQVDNAPKRRKSTRKVGVSPDRCRSLSDQIKHGEKRHTCRSCGMSYAHRSNHYRVVPNIGSEHRRRMAANSAAAQSHLGAAAGVETTPDIQMSQMVFEISSREPSPEQSLTREDRELLGEIIE